MARRKQNRSVGNDLFGNVQKALGFPLDLVCRSLFVKEEQTVQCIYMETIALTMLFPLVKQGAGRPFLLGMMTASVSLSMTLFMMLGLLGVERASRLTFPVYTVVQEVSIGEVIVNIHSIISFILLILIFIKLLVLVYGASETLRQVFCPKTRWPHFLALVILLSAASPFYYYDLY